MGIRIHKTFDFITRKVGSGVAKAAVSVVSGGKSAVTGIKSGAKKIDTGELFVPPKPQATRRSKKP